MKANVRVLVLVCIIAFVLAALFNPLPSIAAEPVKSTKKKIAFKTNEEDKLSKANASFDVSKMSDMSDYDPANPVIPTGDTIKIAVVASFSGPAANQGAMEFSLVQWAAHDINKRGGIWVDGKKKLVQVFKADSMSKPDQTKKVCERMALHEKVHAFYGTDGSIVMKIINEVANRHKIIALNALTSSDDCQDATNFGRYAFQSFWTSDSIGRGLAYYYGKIRKKEKKFYILNQDYAFGRLIAESFKNGLKEFYPEAQIVGEDYHKLFITDFAPYMTKIKASDAEVIFSADWAPDIINLLKQSRQMGVNLPIANLYLNDSNGLEGVGIAGSEGIVHIDTFDVTDQFKNPNYVTFFNAWVNQWKTWKSMPYNALFYKYQGCAGNGAAGTMAAYWLLSVIERAQSTDPEKIIKVWEGDTYRSVTGKVLKMRSCDHKAIQDLYVSEYVAPAKQNKYFTIPPYYWYENFSYAGPTYKIPADKILPWMDEKLDRCKGKNRWGE